MPSIAKPRISHPSLAHNELGLTVRDYEGTMSTLCAGCGHDSITAAIVRALWEISAPPHMIGKLSGIGCSSKTPAYFVNGAHGFNSCHGRMPAIATGAIAANREMMYIGVSGDGDSLSIGLGHMCHAIRRNIRMVYVIENNGVYGLTKGQFSASSDVGSKSKKGEANKMTPIDPALLGLSLGATFIARAFSGDKEQLVPILKAAFSHRGFALVDVISPCVTFNDHEGSTKSYAYIKEHDEPLHEIDFVPVFEDIAIEYDEGTTREVRMHDGSRLRLKKLERDYDPVDKMAAIHLLHRAAAAGDTVTGVLYVDSQAPTLIDRLQLVDEPLASLPQSRLRPSKEALEAIMEEMR